MIGIASIKAELRWADSLQDEQSRHNAKLSIFKDALVTWLRANNPPTLGQLLIANKLKPASVFTHFSNYFCRVSNFPPALQKHRTKPAAEAYSKLDDIKPGWRIVCRFHHEHLTSNSSWSELSGQKRLLVTPTANLSVFSGTRASGW